MRCGMQCIYSSGGIAVKSAPTAVARGVFVGTTLVAKVRSAELWSMVLLALGSVEASIAVKTAPTGYEAQIMWCAGTGRWFL